MSTSTPQAPSPSKPPNSTFDAASQAKIIHNLSLGALILCPILILLPPRKLDKYTFALLAGTFVGGNQLSKEYTGISMMQRFGSRMESFGHALPPKAQEMQVRLQEEKRRREEANGIEETRRKGEELSRREGERRKEDRGVLEKVWYGAEGEDWKEKRDRREKEALEEGKGYWDLITEQIWEVWNGERNKLEKIKEIDVKVVEERKGLKEEGKK